MSDEIRWNLKQADPATFTGQARIALLGSSADDHSLKLFYVRFEPGGRTNWHAHAGPQTLLITDGRCLVQFEGEPIRILGAGQTISIPPGVRHWHGAGPDEGAAHIAINVDNPRTEWYEPVSETA